MDDSASISFSSLLKEAGVASLGEREEPKMTLGLGACAANRMGVS